MQAPHAVLPVAAKPALHHRGAGQDAPTDRQSVPLADQFLAGKPEPEGGYSPELDEDVLASVRRLVASSPEDALAWAGQTSNAAWRIIMEKIVIQVWAESEPEAALEWAREIRGEERETAIEAALSGLAHRPDVAVALGRSLLVEEPDLADTHSVILLGALVRDGQFASAARLASFAPAQLCDEWIETTFVRWARMDHAAAAAALGSITEPDLYEKAYRMFVAGWADADPQKVADYALTLSAVEFRTFALQNAFEKWSRQDPAALANWLADVPPSPEFDLGASLFIARSDRANRDTATALIWAENISEPGLRYKAVRSVLEELKGN